MTDRLGIRYVRLDQITPDPRNAKLHHRPAIKDSIRRYGFRDALIEDSRTGVLSGGHGRVGAAQEMRLAGEPVPRYVQVDDDGMWLVPVQTGGQSADDLEASGFNLTLNRLQDLAGYHQENLLAQLDDLNAGAPDLFEELRFDEGEMDELLRRGGGILDEDENGRADPGPKPGQEGDIPLDELEDKPAKDERPSMLRCEACGHMNPTRV